MTKHVVMGARARNLALAILVVALLGFAIPIPVNAQGLAISGNFYLQHFELMPGQSLISPEVYVVVFNNGENDVRVKLTADVPLGVELTLPTKDFTLPSGESRQLEVGINVGVQVPPGEYDLILTAEAYREGPGIKITGAAQQQARLTVSAEAGEVDISTISPQGEPFITIIRLYKQIDGQNLPSGYSETGSLKTKLTPGDYLAEAYYQGAKVAQETFGLAANETKTITLVPQTVYIEGFAVVRNYYSETGEIAFAKIVYTINNTHQPLKDATAMLKVSREGELVGETELISVPTLDVGITANSYSYIPTEGWQQGPYNFKIELYAQGEFYTQSQEIQMSTEPAAAQPAAEVGAATNWPLIGGIAGAVAFIALPTAFVVWRRRGY